MGGLLTWANFLSSFWRIFLKESFCQNFYLLTFPRYPYLKKNVTSLLILFFVKDFKEKEVYFWQNNSFKNFLQKDDNVGSFCAFHLVTFTRIMPRTPHWWWKALKDASHVGVTSEASQAWSWWLRRDEKCQRTPQWQMGYGIKLGSMLLTIQRK